MIRTGFIRPVPAPTSAERSAAAITFQRLFRAKKEKVNTKLAFRKSLPYVKAVLQKTKGSGGLTSNELNRLSKIVHATLTTGFNSPENASFFLSKYPNKNDPYYRSIAPVYKAKVNALAREKAAITFQRAFRKTLPYVKGVLKKIKGSERLKNNEINELARLIHINQSKGLSSTKNIVFFLTKFPNKNYPYYTTRAPILKKVIKERANKININKGVRVLSNAYRTHQNQLRANEHRRAINNISQLITSRRRNETSGVAQALLGQQRTRETAVGRFNTIGVAPLRVPIPPKSLSNSKNIHDLERMINQMSVNNQRFINAKKFVKNTFSNLEPEPNAPNRTGKTIRQYSKEKTEYESLMRNWLRTAARRWYRNRAPTR
jgi:hypothetical protein